MIDLSKIPVTEQHRIFSNHKEKILSLIGENSRWLDGIPWGDGIETIQNHCSNFISSFLNFLSVEEIKILGNTDLSEDYSHETVSAITDYINVYLEYEAYSDEIRNALVLYLKEDSAGRLMFGRAEKEIAKIASRNGLYNLCWRGEGGGAYMHECAMEIIYGEIVLNKPNAIEPYAENSGLDFEKTCMEKLHSLGYRTSLTKKSGDFGCDILAEKDGLMYAIQCKYSSSKVGVKAVQEAASARKYYKADMAVVVTNGSYTSAANELAVENKVIILLDSQLERLAMMVV